MPEESPLVDIIHAYSNLASAIANQLDGQQLAQDLAQIRQVTQKECGTGQLYNGMLDSAIAQLLSIHGDDPSGRH